VNREEPDPHAQKHGHVDLSFYGFLAGYLYANAPIGMRMVEQAGLEPWVAEMQKQVTLERLFPKNAK